MKLLQVSGLIMLSSPIVLTAATPFSNPLQNPTQPLPIQKRDATPVVGADGICFTYILQAQDSCQALAQQYSLSVPDIDSFNSQTWGWSGCDNIKQGSFICLSPGDPPMPVALGQAICGPQVPGTARPKQYFDLASLNPCPPGKCCSSSGVCGTTPDFCLAENCIANCGVKQDAPPVDETTTSDKVVPGLMPAEATIAESPKETTVAQPEPLTETQKKAATKAIEAPLPSQSWEIAVYSKKGCTGDYYLLRGYNKQRKDRYDTDGCVDLTGNTNTDITQASTSCRWWKDEGLSWTTCSESTLKDPKSWVITSGDCTAYSDRKCKSEAGRIYGPWLGCQNSRGAPLTPKTFRSLVCAAI